MIDPYRMMRTSGPAEKSTRPIVHAWCAGQYQRNPLWLHALAVAALPVVVTLIFYTTAVLDYPFNGDLRVEPDAFELVLDRIG